MKNKAKKEQNLNKIKKAEPERETKIYSMKFRYLLNIYIAL